MTRIELQEKLEEILGTENVYFQPPETIKMKYPCIVYERSGGDSDYADDNPYSYRFRYTVTVIDRNPDSLIPGKVALLPMCNIDRHFTSNNLNHDVFTLYI